jgi:hypothetical protein
MVKVVTIVVALGLTVAIGLWSKSSAVNGSPTVQTISIQELHALAHLEGLPIQHFEDKSVIYPALAEK